MKEKIIKIMQFRKMLTDYIFGMKQLMIVVAVVFMSPVITSCFEQDPLLVEVKNCSYDTIMCVVNRNPGDSLCPDFDNPYESVVLKSRGGFVYITESDSTRNLMFPSVVGESSFGYEYNSVRNPFSSKRPYYYLLVYNWADIKGLSYSEIRNGNYELSRRKITQEDVDLFYYAIILDFPADFELLREVEVK